MVMAVWEGKSLDELRALASGREPNTDPFTVLLSRLAEQHRQDVSSAVWSLQQENQRLRAELGARHGQGHHPAGCAREGALGMSINSSAPVHDGFCFPPPAEPPPLPGMILDSSRTQNNGITDISPTDISPTDISPTDISPTEIDTRVEIPYLDEGGVASREHGSRKSSKAGSRADGHRATRSTQLNGVVQDLCGQNRSKYIRRFRQILNLNSSTTSNKKLFVESAQLLDAFATQGQILVFDVDRITEILSELNIVDTTLDVQDEAAVKASGVRTPKSPQAGRIAFLKLVDVMMVPNLPDLVDPTMEKDVRNIQYALLNETTNLDGLIENVTQMGCVDTNHDDSEVFGWRHRYRSFLKYMDAVTMVVVILSLLVLGASMDISPTWVGWLIIEGLICTFLISEVVIKLVWFGPKKFFCGDDRRMHWLDVFVSLLAFLDLMVTTASYNSSEKSTGSRVTMLLRCFRMARIVRLAKLMRSRTLKELADLFTGFVIGMPWLLWVMVILFVTTYFVALIFRQVVGPAEDSRFMDKCGSADSIIDPSDPDCQTRYLYGEEFFGSVPDSMFTLFRCMIGDCSTKGGQALAAHFSASYGLRFQVIYSIGMIVVIFGLFNIITALFVEATLNGLKSSDVQSKYRSRYDRRYVQGKLKALVERIGEIADTAEQSRVSPSGLRRESLDGGRATQDIAMSEALFLTVVKDGIVNGILDDLDVSHFNREGLFEIFDHDGNGQVTVRELVDTLLHLRGEPQKSDAVASFMALRKLRDNFQSSMYVLLENQQQIIRDQQEQWQSLWKALAAKDASRVKSR